MDLTTLALAKNYTDKQIEKALISGDGDCEPEVMRVVFTSNEDGTYTPDKTIMEVLQAALAGQTVLAVMYGNNQAFALPLVHADLAEMTVLYCAPLGDVIVSVLQSETSITVDFSQYATAEYVDEAIANLPTGGSPAPMELIASGTMEEDARGITITADNDGNPFELTKAALYVQNIYPADDMSDNLGCNVNLGVTWRSGLSASKQSYNNQALAYFNSNGEAWLAIENHPNKNWGSMMRPFPSASFVGNTVSSAALNAGTAVHKLKAGLTYELWGVRK